MCEPMLDRSSVPHECCCTAVDNRWYDEERARCEAPSRSTRGQGALIARAEAPETMAKDMPQSAVVRVFGSSLMVVWILLAASAVGVSVSVAAGADRHPLGITPAILLVAGGNHCC